MTACPRCKAPLPAGPAPDECPACHAALPRTGHDDDHGAALLADDRWDLPSDEPRPVTGPRPTAAPVGTAPSVAPPSFGRPGEGAPPSRRPPPATMAMAPVKSTRPTAMREDPTPTRPLGALDAEVAARALLPKPPPIDPMRSTADLADAPATRPAATLIPGPASRTVSASQPRAPSSAGVPSPSPPALRDAAIARTATTTRASVASVPAHAPMAVRTVTGAASTASPRGHAALGTLAGNVAPVPPPPSSRLVAVEEPAGEPASGRHAPVRRLELAGDASGEVERASEPVRRAVTPPPSSTRAVTVPMRPADATGARATATGSHGAASASSTTSQRQRLVLASEVLREDLVPHEPDERAMRRVLAGAGAVLLVTAAVELLRGPHALSPWAIPGVTALIVAFVPMRYATRALLGFAPALPAFAVQALALPDTRTPGALLFVAVAALLPASLLFRANFRASRRARGFVALALALASAWLIVPGGGDVFGQLAGTGWVMAHVPAVGLAFVMLVSLLAFMGTNTTGGCRAWAVLAVAWCGLVVVSAGAMHAGDFEPTLWPAIAAVSVAALAATMAVTVAGLLAVYARPSEPRTGIGVAATHHPPAPRED